MDPTSAFCPNLDCHARGHIGQGNIGIHSQKDQRFICKQCRQTFSDTKGTVFYRLCTSAETVVIVATMLAHGRPVQAIEAAFGFDERTVADWWARSGRQGQAVHEYLVEQPRDLGQVQADEIRVIKQGDGVINTAYIKRLNATFRKRLAPLARRCRALARQTLTLYEGTFLVGAVYNFCTPHESLHSVQKTIPAMAAEITDHCWTVRELLSSHAPPPGWTPPKQHGRPSQVLKYLIERWCA